jgi:sterol desaturase/sphingolipid hydroxylase (fatty acid hydroxylase superfamily)
VHDVLVDFLVSLGLNFGRYALVAGPAFVVFWLWRGERLRGRWLRPSPPDTPGMRRDIAYSMSSVLVFSAVATALYVGTKAGIFLVYADPARHGLGYLLATPVLLVVLQDAYFYFTHRALHHRVLFRAVHRVHHLSRHTSPFTAYAFSPAEALVHAAFLPLVTLVVPAHLGALFVFLAFMVVRNVHGHLAIELWPAHFAKSPFWSMHTTTTHHALHHLRPNTHFGLYFTLWDHLLGTDDATYAARFDEAARGKVGGAGDVPLALGEGSGAPLAVGQWSRARRGGVVERSSASTSHSGARPAPLQR